MEQKNIQWISTGSDRNPADSQTKQSPVSSGVWGGGWLLLCLCVCVCLCLPAHRQITTRTSGSSPILKVCLLKVCLSFTQVQYDYDILYRPVLRRLYDFSRCTSVLRPCLLNLQWYFIKHHTISAQPVHRLLSWSCLQETLRVQVREALCVWDNMCVRMCGSV